MTLQPTTLTLLDDQHLQIVWSDDVEHVYPLRTLRERCPCASCNEKRKAPPPPSTQLNVLAPEETRPLAIAQMNPMGRYAYSIHFSDGHDTGLFTLDFLRALGEELA
ncbi:DUF971 domain-containing protein [Adhaeretor mobilis]|uniref:Gamma-butyrobetaine hydroxylase-like N-terminal domain-containing protein n=1 Tax=Adhaeretor mobilis TaxID=1930276 RepID=A0A517N0Y0_9BACT|nr:DUF971 domain-containing protein [Adhaeretor mobilis]QDT00774.1 hypothetical protein HG15A2_41150 [Adhaeretor mobilis]